MAMPFVAANWKMNTTLSEAVWLVEEIREELCAIQGVERVLCPPFVSLARVGEMLQGTPIKLGAQDMHFEEKGAYTGEISPLMLRDLCQYVIVGHSERRHIFGEDDETVNKKVQAGLKAGLRPILCVGELLPQRDAGQAEEVVARQVHAGLEGVSDAGTLVIAYEPVWAIGTGRPSTGQDANVMMGIIRKLLADLFDTKAAGHVPLLYGGSVTAENIDQFVSQEHVDGALVGGASLKATEFVEIVRRTAQTRAGRLP